MNAPRIIPAGPMGLDDILPLIREVGQLRERGHYPEAAELEERIRQPITVGGRALPPVEGERWHWQDDNMAIFASVEWRVVLFVDGHVGIRAHGGGPTIASALSDARERYQAAIGDTLLRMGGLLREVGK